MSLTLDHVKEVIEKALAHIAAKREQAAVDHHQYTGALEGAKFVGQLLEEKEKELTKGAGDESGNVPSSQGAT